MLTLESDGGGDEEEEDEENEQKQRLIAAENEKRKYINLSTRLLRLLQLMCEGHFAPLQDHLRC